MPVTPVVVDANGCLLYVNGEVIPRLEYFGYKIEDMHAQGTIRVRNTIPAFQNMLDRGVADTQTFQLVFMFSASPGQQRTTITFNDCHLESTSCAYAQGVAVSDYEFSGIVSTRPPTQFEQAIAGKLVIVTGQRSVYTRSKTAFSGLQIGRAQLSPTYSTKETYQAAQAAEKLPQQSYTIQPKLPTGTAVGMVSPTLNVQKRDGSVQSFSQSKLVASITQAGATQPQATLVANRVVNRINTPTVTTAQLSGMVTRSLSKVNTAASQNYTTYMDRKLELRRKT